MSKKAMTKTIGVYLLLVLLIGEVALLFTPVQPPSLPPGPAWRRAVPELGAASLVPADVAAFSSVRRLGPRLQRIWRSNAVQSLVRLPVAQDVWGEVQADGTYRGMMSTIRNDPRLAQIFTVLGDAVSHEVFWCAGRDLPEFFHAWSEVNGAVQFLQLASLTSDDYEDPDRKVMASLIDTVLKNKERLRVPSFLLGFKLTDKKAAQESLDTWLPKLAEVPIGTFDSRTIGGDRFYVYELSGEDIPRRALAALGEAPEVAAEQAEDLVAWIRSQRLTLALGIRGDYLIFSVGRDTSLLARWGAGPSLAESEAFEPLRRHYRRGLLDVSYVSAEMAAASEITGEDVRQTLTALGAAVPDSWRLKRRLARDLDLLAKDIEEEIPKPVSTLAFSFENRGIETYSFRPVSPPVHVDYSRPLSILAHRGRRPAVCAAYRPARRGTETYDKAVKWLTVAFGYFQDLALPEFDPSALQNYRKVMEIATPFLRAADRATREDLIPAVDGCQTMLVLDGGGKLTHLDDGTALPAAVPLPRVGAAVGLNDPVRFQRAFERYAAAARKLIADLRREFPDILPPWLEIPTPETRPAAGGTLYSYRWPWNLGQDVFPCALLTERVLLLSSSAAQAKEMAEPVPMPAPSVIDPSRAAGGVFIVDCTKCWDAFGRLADAGFKLAQPGLSPEKLEFAGKVKLHVDAVLRSLEAIRGYRSVTTRQGEHIVTHSWLHVEDIAE